MADEDSETDSDEDDAAGKLSIFSQIRAGFLPQCVADCSHSEDNDADNGAGEEQIDFSEGEDQSHCHGIDAGGDGKS